MSKRPSQKILKDETITVRLTASTKAKLMELCQREDRSAGWLLTKWIEDAYEKKR